MEKHGKIYARQILSQGKEMVWGYLISGKIPFKEESKTIKAEHHNIMIEHSLPE